MPAYQNEDLYSSILELGVMDKDKLDQALKESQDRKIPLGNILLQKELISDENLGKIISDSLSLPLIRLSKADIPDSVLKIIPENLAKRKKIIAYGLDKDGLKLAMADPTDEELKNLLSQKVDASIKVSYATEKDIDEALSKYKVGLQSSFDELLAQQVAMAGKAESKEAPVQKLVDLLIEYAYMDKASDIHIEPEENDILVRFRVDGVLHDMLHLPKNLHDQVVTRIKVLSNLRTDEHLSAQDGKMKMKLEQEDLDIRVSILPIVEGEKVVLRLLSSRSRQFSLTDLGMSEKDLQKVRDGFNKPYGMVLSTGPTGSGKTTTIYAILKILNTRDKNISTIEDPVEYDIDNVNQIQVNPKTNLTFADGLRAILRQDPDIIFVGEIRDEETAGIAVNSAMTGHLVLSTLHTNDAATSLPRLIDMKIEPFLIASTVNVIIGQRLVRKICDKCKVSSVENYSDMVKKFHPELVKRYFGKKKTAIIFHGKGCPVCHGTGYNGRIGIFEVLEVSDEIQQLIVQKADASVIAKQAINEGMTTMMDDGLEKVQLGLTTLEEVLRATKE